MEGLHKYIIQLIVKESEINFAFNVDQPFSACFLCVSRVYVCFWFLSFSVKKKKK